MTESQNGKSIYSDYSIAEIKEINAFTLPHVVHMGQWIENPPTHGLEGVVTATSNSEFRRRQMAQKNK